MGRESRRRSLCSVRGVCVFVVIVWPVAAACSRFPPPPFSVSVCVRVSQQRQMMQGGWRNGDGDARVVLSATSYTPMLCFTPLMIPMNETEAGIPPYASACNLVDAGRARLGRRV
jgi:hypothetical protein